MVGSVALLVLWSVVVWAVAFGRGQEADRAARQAFEARVQFLETNTAAMDEELYRAIGLIQRLAAANKERAITAESQAEALATVETRLGALEKRPVAVVRQTAR